MGRRLFPPPPKLRVRNLKSSKKQIRFREAAKHVVVNIVEILDEMGIEVPERRRMQLVDMVASDDAKFSPEILPRLFLTDMETGKQVRRILAERGYPTSMDDDIMEFDSRMEQFFRRAVAAKNINVTFIRARDKPDGARYTMHVRIENHWQLGRLLGFVETASGSLSTAPKIKRPFYHTIMDDKHLDCVDIDTGDIPIAWVLSVEIPDCSCGENANMTRTDFVGEDWL